MRTVRTIVRQMVVLQLYRMLFYGTAGSYKLSLIRYPYCIAARGVHRCDRVCSGDFVPKEEIRARLKAAEERSAVPAEMAVQTDTGSDTEGLQATVSLALNFRRQVKRPLLRAKSALGELDEKQLAEIAHAEREIKEKIHSRLVRAQVRCCACAHCLLTSTVFLAFAWCLLHYESHCTGCKEMEQSARSCHAKTISQLAVLSCTMSLYLMDPQPNTQNVLSLF